MVWQFSSASRNLRHPSWLVLLKSALWSPVCTALPALADRRQAGSTNSTSDSDVKRTGLLAAIRRAAIFVMAALPVFVLAFGSKSWSPLVLVVATTATLVSCAVSAELWRRLRRLSDVTTLNEELRYRSTHDLLMQIPNRELLQVELANALVASGGQAGGVGVLFMDLDRFKFVNDSLGHAAGDELLKAVGLGIKSALTDENMLLARVGGDELVVLLRSLTSVDHLSSVADRLLAMFVDPFTIDGVELRIGTSIGMAVAVAGETADELYRHADAALYEAKARGRGQAVLADADLRAKRDARVRTEMALREALANDQIEAWFQPEVDMVTGEVIAAEVLARWRTDNGVEIASSFIDIARRAGMLEQLMIKMAGQVWAWRRLSGSNLPVALNVSAAHLPSLLAMHEEDQIARPFVGMRLEIAETDIIHDFDGVRTILNRLRELGAEIMLDDFGAGYSSLQMLSDLPIDGIKIDRSYVARIETDWRVRNLVTSLAEFARSTNMIVVVEGVETSRQADFLTKIGIDRGQGFLFSKAIDADEFAILLNNGPVGAQLASCF
jgi:diguanylate cyclase (GGDEF)-like protein